MNSGIQDFWYSGFQEFSNSGIQELSNSGTQGFSNSGRQGFRKPGTQEFRNSGIQQLGNSLRNMNYWILPRRPRSTPRPPNNVFRLFQTFWRTNFLPGSCQVLAKFQRRPEMFVRSGQAQRPTAKAVAKHQGWSGGVCPRRASSISVFLVFI